jgi:hypothetical protein
MGGRWQRYWFGEGGRTALAIVRIAVAASVLLTLVHLAGRQSPIASHVYRPVGIWMLLGHNVPPEGVVSVLWGVAWVSSAAMLVGLATRASLAISFLASVALTALSFSASPTWSHQYNVVFLAQLALVGGRTGDTLSVDAWIRRRRGQPPKDDPGAYQWSLRLAQLAVVLMFVGAAFHKLLHGHFTLRWALSDNLRHHLLVRYDLAGTARPAFVDWLLAESWRYEGAALLNMMTQAAPLVAVIFVRHPLVRAAAGMLFVVETIMLGVVTGLWNLHWLPLVAVFIDWERLLARVRGASPAIEQRAQPSWRPPRWLSPWIVAFLAYDVLTGFVPTLDQRLNTYPFSGFPMFATIRAREPYDEHQPYSLVGGTYEVFSDHPIDRAAQRWLDHIHRNVHVVRNPDELQRRLKTVLERMQHFYPDYGIHGLRLWITVFEAPAYPEPARFEKRPIAVLGELVPDGAGTRFRTLLGRLDDHDVLTPMPREIELPPTTKLVYYRDERAEPIDVRVPFANGRFDLRSQVLAGNPRYFVAVANGVPWLVTSEARVRW